MGKMIDMNDYKDDLQKGDYESIYNDIINASIDLANKIAKIKNIKLNDNGNIEDRLFDIEFTFKKNCASFREIIYLMKNLRKWKYEDFCDEDVLIEDEDKEKIVFLETKEEKIQNYIKRYNLIILELDRYYSIEKEIKENGYDKLIKQRTEKLIQLFKKMLEFKNQKYGNNWNLQQFVEKIRQYYSFYSEQLSNVISITNIEPISYDINEDSIRINEVESIMYVDDFYNELTCDDDYKNYADSELEDNLLITSM